MLFISGTKDDKNLAVLKETLLSNKEGLLNQKMELHIVKGGEHNCFKGSKVNEAERHAEIQDAVEKFVAKCCK